MAVGSSNTIHSGSIAMIPAIATLCFCPPERWLGLASLCAIIPTPVRAAVILVQIFFGSTPRFSGPKAVSSSTVVPTIWLSGFWNTIPALCLTSKSVRSSFVSIPLIYTAPSVGINNPLICFASEDFPEPFFPRIATNSPFSTSISIWSIAAISCLSSSSSPYVIYL